MTLATLSNTKIGNTYILKCTLPHLLGIWVLKFDSLSAIKLLHSHLFTKTCRQIKNTKWPQFIIAPANHFQIVSSAIMLTLPVLCLFLEFCLWYMPVLMFEASTLEAWMLLYNCKHKIDLTSQTQRCSVRSVCWLEVYHWLAKCWSFLIGSCTFKMNQRQSFCITFSGGDSLTAAHSKFIAC